MARHRHAPVRRLVILDSARPCGVPPSLGGCERVVSGRPASQPSGLRRLSESGLESRRAERATGPHSPNVAVLASYVWWPPLNGAGYPSSIDRNDCLAACCGRLAEGTVCGKALGARFPSGASHTSGAAITSSRPAVIYDVLFGRRTRPGGISTQGSPVRSLTRAGVEPSPRWRYARAAFSQKIRRLERLLTSCRASWRSPVASGPGDQVMATSADRPEAPVRCCRCRIRRPGGYAGAVLPALSGHDRQCEDPVGAGKVRDAESVSGRVQAM